MKNLPYLRKIRLFVNKPLNKGESIALLENQAHYLYSVMRCKKEDLILLFNGKDGQWLGEILEITKKQTIIFIKEQQHEQKNKEKLSIAFAPIKHVNTSFIVEKATEMGVTNIHPILTERSVIRKINIEKLNECSIQASEQSERMCIPYISELIGLQKFFTEQALTYDAILFLNERSNSDNLYNTLKMLDSYKTKIKNNLILIGPEGGFSEYEKQYIVSFSNVRSIKLCNDILRSETAIISGIAIYQSIAGGWIK